ncbi:MAG: colanic acid biosynthesis acetyltransferase WcaF [Sphingobacteriales bacterium]|uniref:WcaF family extracellular polysaccharide biosynthesis acetyltransferase n=1 Tax=Hydrotalea flava TaxID=714549 RepID=UPI00082C4A36|nr:WcaF family extracellular polysaccharide biosynthesis acetyltransferase [Hydrotalea flava]RTL49067.1 MAG: colanic acid biosynthesis acetyltransferase WcaF [Sphingobacteriales bacterium]
MKQVQLQQYNNSWYNPGGSALKRMLWYYTNAGIFQTSWLPFSSIKVQLLRWFGAKVGKRVVIKPCVNIKYPWHLQVGDDVWIGEEVWIDNLTTVQIGSNVCISQQALLITGNHHYGKATFDLMVQPITLHNGVWIGAQAVVAGGVTCGEHSVLTLRSVATKDLLPNGIYSGHPAIRVRKRIIE